MTLQRYRPNAVIYDGEVTPCMAEDSAEGQWYCRQDVDTLIERMRNALQDIHDTCPEARIKAACALGYRTEAERCVP